jgi:hypothetical protein
MSNVSYNTAPVPRMQRLCRGTRSLLEASGSAWSLVDRLQARCHCRRDAARTAL